MGTLASELRAIATELADGPRVYVDANVPMGLVSIMRREFGWDVLFVLEHQELRRAPDRDHFQRALDLGRTLITLDHDFVDEHRFPQEFGPGVIICTAPDEAALRRVLKYADRTLLRVSSGPLPLRGRKIHLTLDVVRDDVSRR